MFDAVLEVNLKVGSHVMHVHVHVFQSAAAEMRHCNWKSGMLFVYRGPFLWDRHLQNCWLTKIATMEQL